MKEYFLEEFKNEEAYKRFIEYMLLKSDYFSLICFEYRENEKLKSSTKTIFNSLKKFKKFSRYTKRWPNTETYDEKHIYQISLYQSSIECLQTLTRVKDIYEWDYPDAPMDLCFYRDGYCWLAITAHEQMAFLYTDNKEEVKELVALGADLEFWKKTDTLFYLNSI